MKLHCPHCGVKGSAEDSYSGRKVRCPKCQGVFKVTPDMAFERKEDAPFPAVHSSITTESPGPAVAVETPIAADESFTKTLAVGKDEDAAEIDKEAAEPEPETTPAAEHEESLDWDELASEIDRQLSQEGAEEEQQEVFLGNPAEEILQDDFAVSAEDFGPSEEKNGTTGNEPGQDIQADGWDNLAKREESGLFDDSSHQDSVIAESSVQEKASVFDDDNEVFESMQESAAEDGARQQETVEEIEQEPYGIEDEQCWQCGKKDSVDGSFVAKDGRLYCTDCITVGASEETSSSIQEQNAGDPGATQATNADDADMADNPTSIEHQNNSIAGAIRRVWTKLCQNLFGDYKKTE